MKKIILCVLLLFLTVQIPAFAAESYPDFEIEASKIEVSESTVTVELSFHNTTGHEFSYGWAGTKCSLVVVTSSGEYILDIGSAGNRVATGDTIRTFQVDCPDASEIQSVRLTNLIPLTAQGLPQTEGLDTVTFDADILVSPDVITFAEPDKAPVTSAPAEARSARQEIESTREAILGGVSSAYKTISVMQMVVPLFVLLIITLVVVLATKMTGFLSVARKITFAPTQANAELLLRRMRKLGIARFFISANMYYGQRAALGDQFSKSIYPSPDISDETKDAIYKELLALGIVHLNK